jgi:hypothetical protein
MAESQLAPATPVPHQSRASARNRRPHWSRDPRAAALRHQGGWGRQGVVGGLVEDLQRRADQDAGLGSGPLTAGRVDEIFDKGGGRRGWRSRTHAAPLSPTGSPEATRPDDHRRRSKPGRDIRPRRAGRRRPPRRPGKGAPFRRQHPTVPRRRRWCRRTLADDQGEPAVAPTWSTCNSSARMGADGQRRTAPSTTLRHTRTSRVARPAPTTVTRAPGTLVLMVAAGSWPHRPRTASASSRAVRRAKSGYSPGVILDTCAAFNGSGAKETGWS